MRKYFYLITEHEEDERVGAVSVMDSPMSRPNKDSEAPIMVLDDDKEGFREVGQKVGLGYHDFEDESEYDDADLLSSVMMSKIQSVDRKWAEKADIAEEVYDE